MRLVRRCCDETARRDIDEDARRVCLVLVSKIE
jgi:hypothetical protein